MACDCNGKTMNNGNSCDLQIQKLVQGRMLGRSSGDCKDSPGTWEPCVPRNVQFDFAHTFDPAVPASVTVQVEYRNGTNEMLALLDVIIDEARAFAAGPPVVVTDVRDQLVLTEILGAQTADESYGTFAGRGSAIRDAAGADLPGAVIGRLGTGISLDQLSAERAAAFGASPNYGSILSKIKLPVIAPQQSFSLTFGLSNGLPVGTVVGPARVSGSILAVQFSKAAYEAIYNG